MKQVPNKQIPPWDRSKDFLTDEKHLKLFHTILVLVENDDANRLKGYDWKKLKKAIGKSVGIYNSTEQQEIYIPDCIDKDTVYFKEKNSVASNFIKSLRHAFAHNFVRYDATSDMIEICLPSYNKKSVRLRCLISYKKLCKIIKELKNQKKRK